MAVRIVAFGLCLAALSPAALADPVLKLVNFTADWCPNCRILDPKLEEAATAFGDDVALVELDTTLARGGASTVLAHGRAARTAARHGVGHLWAAYGGETGFAVITAADTGEALICVFRDDKTADIILRLKQSRTLALKAPPGRRAPAGPYCPDSMD